MTHHLPHPGLAKLPIPRKFALGGIEPVKSPFPRQFGSLAFILILSSPFVSAAVFNYPR